MNYKSIFAKAIVEYKTQKTPYSTIFKRESRNAHDLESEEYDDFFDGCLRIISIYKKHIEALSLKDYKENDRALYFYKQNLLNGVTTDQTGKPIQDHIDRIESEKQLFKPDDYKTDYNIKCFITETGEITESTMSSIDGFYYNDLEELEKTVLNFKNNLSSKTNESTHARNELKKNKLNIVLIDKIYNFCIETKVLDENTVSNVDFIKTVESADFSIIYEHSKEQQSSTKMRYIIYVLNKFISINDWFLNAAHSIDTEPSKCSGVNVPTNWKNKANAIK